MSGIRQVRIWNPETKQFMFSGRTPMMQSEFWIKTATLNTVRKIPYEYETGLKDSKGVDVYEGDIVTITSEMEDVTLNQVVKWHPEGGYFAECFDGGDYVPMLGADDYTLTIIGTIHDKEQV